MDRKFCRGKTVAISWSSRDLRKSEKRWKSRWKIKKNFKRFLSVGKSVENKSEIY